MTGPTKDVGQTHSLPGFLVNWAKDHFQSYQVSVTKTEATRVSDSIKLLPSKYTTMPKTSSNDQIDTAFEEIAQALNNPKLQERFLNVNKENEILNELIDIFDQRSPHKIAHVPARESHKPNPDKITHVPAKVKHDSLLTTGKINSCPRVNHSPNTQKIAHVPARGEPMCDQKPVEMKIPKPLTHFPNGTFIYKLFNKKYWRATIIQFDTTKEYYTVRYNDNNEEEFTQWEITVYLTLPEKEEYWIEK